MANEGLRAQPHKIHAGAFQWTPNFILYGKQLEINALGLEMLSQKLNISSPVEIEPFHAPKEKETTISGFFVIAYLGIDDFFYPTSHSSNCCFTLG